ncbi:carbohydrate ABC transporter permease [Lachnospiraceae bacterium YH-ros2228]
MKQKDKYPYSMALPGLILFTVFFIAPSVIGLFISLFKMYGFNFAGASFTGLGNYIGILSDGNTRKALINSFIFAIITTVFKMLFGMLLAVALNKRLFLTNALRTIFFLPAVINTVAVGLIFSSIMHPEKGLLNRFLSLIGLGALRQAWLTNPKIAIFSICLIEIWKWSGFTMVILLTGMQNISTDYYESAELEGATEWQKFWKITFPLLLPSINNALILSIIGGLKVFDIVQATTQGGPGSATEVFGTLIYKSFGSGRFAEGCAASVLLAVIIAVIVLPTYKLIANQEVEV